MDLLVNWRNFSRKGGPNFKKRGQRGAAHSYTTAAFSQLFQHVNLRRAEFTSPIVLQHSSDLHIYQINITMPFYIAEIVMASLSIMSINIWPHITCVLWWHAVRTHLHGLPESGLYHGRLGAAQNLQPVTDVISSVLSSVTAVTLLSLRSCCWYWYHCVTCKVQNKGLADTASISVLRSD